jgi:hypothetical protein
MKRRLGRARAGQRPTEPLWRTRRSTTLIACVRALCFEQLIEVLRGDPDVRRHVELEFGEELAADCLPAAMRVR